MAWLVMATEWAISRPGSPHSPVAGLLRCGGPYEDIGEAYERAAAAEQAHHERVVQRARDPEVYDAVVQRWLREIRISVWPEEDVTSQRALGARVDDTARSIEDVFAIADARIAVSRARALTQKEEARRELRLEDDDRVLHEVECHGLWKSLRRYVQRQTTCLVTEWWLILIGAPEPDVDDENPARIDIPLSDLHHLKSGGGHGHRADGRPTCYLEIGSQNHGFYSIWFGVIDDPDDWTPAWRLERILRQLTGIRDE